MIVNVVVGITMALGILVWIAIAMSLFAGSTPLFILFSLAAFALWTLSIMAVEDNHKKAVKALKDSIK